MVVTIFLRDMLALGTMYDVSRRLQRELYYKFCPAVVIVRVSHFCWSKQSLF